MPTYDPTDTVPGTYDPAPIDPVAVEIAALCADIADLVKQMQQANEQMNAARRLYEDMTR